MRVRHNFDGKDLEISVQQRTVTTATIRHKGQVIVEGEAILNPLDKNDPLMARRISLGRAFYKLGQKPGMWKKLMADYDPHKIAGMLWDKFKVKEDKAINADIERRTLLAKLDADKKRIEDEVSARNRSRYFPSHNPLFGLPFGMGRGKTVSGLPFTGGALSYSDMVKKLETTLPRTAPFSMPALQNIPWRPDLMPTDLKVSHLLKGLPDGVNATTVHDGTVIGPFTSDDDAQEFLNKFKRLFPNVGGEVKVTDKPPFQFKHRLGMCNMFYPPTFKYRCQKGAGHLGDCYSLYDDAMRTAGPLTLTYETARPTSGYLQAHRQQANPAPKPEPKLEDLGVDTAGLNTPEPVSTIHTQCCERDNDGDGNCGIHSAPGVLRTLPRSRFRIFSW